MRRTALIFGATLTLVGGCDRQTGGVTARLVIEGSEGAQRALRTREVPTEVSRLEITVKSKEGEELGKTVLAADPSPGLDEVQLVRAGGTWTIDDVPAGADRVLEARALLDTTLPPSLAGKVGFAGERGGIEITADAVTNAGTIELTLQSGIRIPRLDRTPPAAPGPAAATSRREGGALDVTWTRPTDDDVGGYLVAITRSATVTTPEPTARDFGLLPGSELAPGVRVIDWFRDPDALGTAAVGLTDGAPYRVFVFAYDLTLEDTPLNFSRAAEALGMPSDTDPPGTFGNLRMAALGDDAVTVTFVAPGEDTAGGGPPMRYEVRTSTVRARLTDPVSFAALPRLTPPPVASPGMTGMFDRTFDELEQAADRGFFLGIRAIDEADNLGPIGVVEYALTATLAPAIDTITPEVGVAGQPITIDGALFGAAPGAVLLVVEDGGTTTTTTLTAGPWTASRISAVLPGDARSGRILVLRDGDGAMAAADLSVLTRQATPPDPALLPFEIASAPLPGRTAAHAIYEAIDGGATIEHSIRRILGDVVSLLRSAPFLDGATPQAISGTYSGAYDRFAFAAAGTNEITGGFVSTATVPTELRRRLAPIVGADGVGLLLLPPTATTAPSAIPALLAFSVGGLVRTATVQDVNTEAFGPFQIETSTLTLASAAQLVRVGTATATAETFIGYITGTGTTARLALLSQRGAAPGAFAPDSQSRGPLVGQRFAMVDVPGQGLLVAYEYRRADGIIEPRLMMRRFFGLSAGFAPYPRDTADRRLHDVGLVRRGGRVWLALATTTEVAAGGAQLHYAEVDPATVIGDGYGTTRGVRLDIALSRDPMQARLGGKPTAVATTPLLWNGPNGNGQLYLRR